jgi:hypothetical protein
MFKPKGPKPGGAFSRKAGTKSKAPPSVRVRTSSSLNNTNQQCQKCLEFGHYSYECKASERPYKPRPTRTQQLKNPALRPKLAIDEEPNKLLEKYDPFEPSDFRTGIADKVLADKEREREKRRRSESVATFSSSGSVATYSSDEEGGERKRVRRDSRSGSPRSYSSGRSSDRAPSPVRGRPVKRRSTSVSTDSYSERSASLVRDASPERRPVSDSRTRSPPRQAPRRRSPSPRAPPTETAGARSRWDQRGAPPRRERSLSPYSKRKMLAGQ